MIATHVQFSEWNHSWTSPGFPTEVETISSKTMSKSLLSFPFRNSISLNSYSTRFVYIEPDIPYIQTNLMVLSLSIVVERSSCTWHMLDASLRIVQYQTILPPTIHYDCCCTEHSCSAAVSLISKDFPAIREVLCGHRDVLIRIRCNDDLIELQFTLVEFRTNVTSHHHNEIGKLLVSFGSDDLIET